MTKREVFQLLKQISIYYDSFELEPEKVTEWYSVLKGETLQKTGGKFTKTCGAFPLSTSGIRISL